MKVIVSIGAAIWFGISTVMMGQLPHRNTIPDHCMLAMPVAAPQLPPDGNPDHRQPPPDEFCKHDPNDGAHNCNCHRECKDTEDEDGTKSTYVQEDPKCRVWCFKDHCHCKIENCD